jgi:hypothetical protein
MDLELPGDDPPTSPFKTHSRTILCGLFIRRNADDTFHDHASANLLFIETMLLRATFCTQADFYSTTCAVLVPAVILTTACPIAAMVWAFLN